MAASGYYQLHLRALFYLLSGLGGFASSSRQGVGGGSKFRCVVAHSSSSFVQGGPTGLAEKITLLLRRLTDGDGELEFWSRAEFSLGVRGQLYGNLSERITTGMVVAAVRERSSRIEQFWSQGLRGVLLWDAGVPGAWFTHLPVGFFYVLTEADGLACFVAVYAAIRAHSLVGFYS